MSKECTWLFGRGASIANGFYWSVPEKWKSDLLKGRISREEHQNMIIDSISKEMFSSEVHRRPYQNLIDIMATRTIKGGHHKLITTNWDYLLQIELNNWIAENQPGYAPKFLSTNSSVLHLNGTAEPGDFPNRSPFLLETDNANFRRKTIEANIAFNLLLWSSLVVIVGMSFECNIDKGLLGALGACEDEIPLGEADFIIVDPCCETLQNTCGKLQKYFPRSTQFLLNCGLEAWIDADMPELSGRIFVSS